MELIPRLHPGMVLRVTNPSLVPVKFAALGWPTVAVLPYEVSISHSGAHTVRAVPDMPTEAAGFDITLDVSFFPFPLQRASTLPLSSVIDTVVCLKTSEQCGNSGRSRVRATDFSGGIISILINCAADTLPSDCFLFMRDVLVAHDQVRVCDNFVFATVIT
jgi:hypothetical protein